MPKSTAEQKAQEFVLEGLKNYAIWCINELRKQDASLITDKNAMEIALPFMVDNGDTDKLSQYIHSYNPIDNYDTADLALYHALHVIAYTLGLSEDVEEVFENMEKLNWEMDTWFETYPVQENLLLNDSINIENLPNGKIEGVEHEN